MSDKPRRRFQIHLSTALILVVLCGVLIPINIAAPKWLDEQFNLAEAPFEICIFFIALVPCLSIAILGLSVASLEYRIRRREARKP